MLAPDIMLLDASLRDSLALAREVRCLTPGVRVVGFGVTMAEGGFLACAEAGLAGFVGTDGTVEELVTAIERAMRGELLCPPVSWHGCLIASPSLPAITGRPMRRSRY